MQLPSAVRDVLRDHSRRRFLFGLSATLTAALGARRAARAADTELILCADEEYVQALETLGVWNSVRAAVAPAENVSAALLLVSRREASLGIVCATDAAADPGVKIAGVFPEDTHPRIVYPIALTADRKNPNAARLLQFLTSLAARPIFEKRGFTLLQ